MTERKERFDLYLNTPEMGVVKAAQAAILERDGLLKLMQVRYESDYLERTSAFSLDPVQLPLQSSFTSLACDGNGTPGVLDDYLPDSWGRKVLAQLALIQEKKQIRSTSVLDMLSMMGGSRIGALQWVRSGESPEYTLGADFVRISEAEKIAQAIDAEDYSHPSVDEFSLVYLANSGTGVGGARPKALVEHDGKGYLAKFNSLSSDRYNNARVELACLKMAKAAGLNVGGGFVAEGINGREVLMLERFDVAGRARRHLVTLNALMKQASNQMDHGTAFRYDDIADLIRKLSSDPKADLEQLLALMLFNRSINNTDDHERNFSFWHTGQGYQLAPAYDLVPSLARGEYHAAGYCYQPYPPLPKELKGRAFGLSAPAVQRIAERVREALSQWEGFAEDAGVSEEDQSKLKGVISA